MRRLLVPFMSSFLILSSLAAEAAEPIKIGVSLGLSGRYSEMAHMQSEAFTLWAGDVNSRGGILGRKVDIIIYDDKSDPQTAKSLYEHLITQDKVDLLFAPYSSELTDAVAPLFEQYGYPTIASGASSDRLWQKGYKQLFGIISPASRFTVGFVEMLVQYGFTDVAIVYAGDDPFPTDIALGSKKWIEEFGLKVRLFSGFKKGTKNFDSLVKKARESHAQVLMVCGYFDEAVQARLSLKRNGWYPNVYYASVGPTIPAYHERLGPDADYTFSSALWEPHNKIPGSEEFYAEFIKSYGHKPSYHSAEAYAAGEVIERAIKKAGSLDREKIREVLSAMQTTTILGRYGVDKTSRQVKHFPLIIQWQNGRKEIVWPKNLSTAKPIFK